MRAARLKTRRSWTATSRAKACGSPRRHCSTRPRSPAGAASASLVVSATSTEAIETSERVAILFDTDQEPDGHDGHQRGQIPGRLGPGDPAGPREPVERALRAMRPDRIQAER